MALDVYFRQDVAHQITAVAAAMLSAATAQGSINMEYCHGVIDTVRAQAISFGIPWEHVAVPLRQALVQDANHDLLECLSWTSPAGERALVST